MTDTIDPETLEEAIKLADELLELDRIVFVADLRVLCAAARAWLAQQPRFKEVEVERWVIIDPTGAVVDQSWSKDHADRLLKGYTDGCQVVRLTGTAKVKVNP